MGGEDGESLHLPSGWKLKKIEGNRSKKITYYESPSGFLYKSPNSVLSHMTSSGLYSREQVAAFQHQVAKLEEKKIQNSHGGGGGVKRKGMSDDMAAVSEEKKLKRARTTDFRKVLSEMSEESTVKIENSDCDSNIIQVNEFTKSSVQKLVKPNLDDDCKPQYPGMSKEGMNTENIKLEDMNPRFKNYVEVFDDKFVPAGWRVANIPHYMPQNEGTTVTLRRYVSPKGISYSRSMACAFLEKQNDLVNFEIMKQGLLSEGWVRNDQCPIPAKFFFRRHVDTTVQFITPEWKIIKGYKKYKEYLAKNNYDKNYLEGIKLLSRRKISIKVKSENDDPIVVKEEANELELGPNMSMSVPKESLDTNISSSVCHSDDESFPVGWKVSVLGDEIEVSSPSGKKFNSRKNALEFMLKSGEDPATLIRVWKTLSKEGWEEADELLPSGWRVSKSSGAFTFLSRDMKVLTRQIDVINYLKSEKSYSKCDLNNFVKWTKNYPESDCSTKESWISDEDLPEGWKKSESHPFKYLSVSGRVFDDKISALDHLISDHFKPEEIYKLWNTLDEDGWVKDRNLPTGWRRKNKHPEVTFLSPMMQVFHNWCELSDFISLDRGLTPREVLELQKFHILFSSDVKNRTI